MALTKINTNGVSDSAITSAKIDDGSITNDDIKSDAAITAGKLSATLDLSSKTITLPASSVTAHATNPTKASIEALGIDLPAADLTGTIPDARFPSTLPAISGASLTGIDAVVVGTTLPNPVSTEGSLFYKSDTDIFYISNGTQWNLVSNANPAATGGTVTIDALSEGGTFSYDLGDDFTDDVDTDAQLTYTLVSGTLPSGCTLPTTGNSAFTGTASGVSSNTNYTWTIKATDTSGGTATQNYQQTINTVAATTTGGTVTIPAVNEGSSASYDVDTNFTFTTGSTFSAYSLQSGSLPSGLSLNTSSGVISGTMGEVASTTAYSFTIRATDTDGDTADQGYSWTINNTITVSVTSGLIFDVYSYVTSSYSGTGNTWTSLTGSHVGVSTTSTGTNSPTANKAPTVINDADAGNVFDFSGGLNPTSGWFRFSPTIFPSGDLARTYNVWVKYDAINLNNAIGGQDGTPTWAGHNTASAFLLLERGAGYEIIGHGYDKNTSWNETVTGTWLNICVSYDSSTLRFYRNNVLIATVAAGAFNTANTNFFIGRGWSKSDLAGIDGKIAHFSVYNRGLSAAEVTTNWNAMKGNFGY